MNYEQKYNEILEWARKNKARLNGVPIEEVLPELKESEDERIRKAIIHYILYETKGAISEATEHTWVKWLEKQKERKPVERSDDIEQAAARYERENRRCLLSSVDIVNAFIEGAKWMANQMPQPEDTVIFQKGVAEGRRLEREETPRWKKGPADSAIRTRDYWPVSVAPMLGKPETRDYFIVKRGKSLLLAFHAEEGDYYLSTEELDKIPTE